MIPKFDIFSGDIDRDALWIEAVEGLGCAVECMKDLAAQSPGPYSIFCARTHQVLAAIDRTTQDLHKDRRSCT